MLCDSNEWQTTVLVVVPRHASDWLSLEDAVFVHLDEDLGLQRVGRGETCL